MQQEDPNHGRHQEEPRLSRVPQGMSAQDERTWSILAHLSILLNLITGLGGPVAALIIWLVYKDRSQKVAFHALQSLWYQVAWIVILSVGWFITYVLMFVLISASCWYRSWPSFLSFPSYISAMRRIRLARGLTIDIRS